MKLSPRGEPGEYGLYSGKQAEIRQKLQKLAEIRKDDKPKMKEIKEQNR